MLADRVIPLVHLNHAYDLRINCSLLAKFGRVINLCKLIARRIEPFLLLHERPLTTPQIVEAGEESIGSYHANRHNNWRHVPSFIIDDTRCSRRKPLDFRIADPVEIENMGFSDVGRRLVVSKLPRPEIKNSAMIELATRIGYRKRCR
jgi:hypothetical protein